MSPPTVEIPFQLQFLTNAGPEHRPHLWGHRGSFPGPLGRFSGKAVGVPRAGSEGPRQSTMWVRSELRYDVDETSARYNQSTLKEISLEYSLEGLM